MLNISEKTSLGLKRPQTEFENKKWQKDKKIKSKFHCYSFEQNHGKHF